MIFSFACWSALVDGELKIHAQQENMNSNNNNKKKMLLQKNGEKSEPILKGFKFQLQCFELVAK